MSRSLPTLSATNSDRTETTVSKSLTCKDVIVRRDLPIARFLRAEESRKRKFKGKQYKPWYYYIDREVGSREDESPALFTCVNNRTLEESIMPLPLGLRGGRKVAFDIDDADFYPERLPNITPVTPVTPESRSNSATKKDRFNKISSMTIRTRSSPNNAQRMLRKSEDSRNLEEIYRRYWTEEGDSYTISFRQDSREKYDPQSELHSDYYTIKRVDSKKGRIKLADKQKNVTFPSSDSKFSALLLGTSKHLHKKHSIECDGYSSEYFEEMTRPKVLYRMPGHSSVPLTIRNYANW